MKLYTAHIILMASAILGSGSYALWAGVRVMKNPSLADGLMLAGALIVTIGVAIYLRGFVRRVRALDEGSPQQP